jgi:hypothetical protein
MTHCYICARKASPGLNREPALCQDCNNELCWADEELRTDPGLGPPDEPVGPFEGHPTMAGSLKNCGARDCESARLGIPHTHWQQG